MYLPHECSWVCRAKEVMQTGLGIANWNFLPVEMGWCCLLGHFFPKLNHYYWACRGRRFALGCRLRFCETAPTPYADIKTHVWLHKKSFPCYLVKFCMVYNHMNLHDAQLARGHASYNFVFVPIDFFIKLYCLANNWCLS